MILNEDYFGKHINEEFSDDMKFLMDYLKTKEQKDEFIKMYMYILSTGMGDGITESVDNLLTEAAKDDTTGFDNPLKGIMTFIKGRKFVGSYYKGLLAAADKFIQANKKIDKMADSGGENIGKERKIELKQYEDQLKKLDTIKKELDKLKEESFMLAQFEKLAELKYKFKIFRTGKKSKIAAAKLRGYSEQIDDLKKEETKTNKEWEEAQSKAEGQGELAKKFEDDPEMKKFKERSEKIDTKKRRLNLELEGASKEEQAEIKAQLKELEKEEETVDKETNEHIKSQYPDLWKKLEKEEEEAKKNKKADTEETPTEETPAKETEEGDTKAIEKAQKVVDDAKTKLETAQGEYDKVKDGEDEEAKKKANEDKLKTELQYQRALMKLKKVKGEDQKENSDKIDSIMNQLKDLGIEPPAEETTDDKTTNTDTNNSTDSSDNTNKKEINEPKSSKEKELSKIQDELDDLEDNKDELEAKKQKAQIDADLEQKKKEKEEAKTKNLEEIKNLKDKIKKAYDLLDEKEKEKDKTDDTKEKENIQQQIIGLEDAITKDEKKLAELESQTNESILPISFFYDLILLEKSISYTIDKLNGNA